MKVQLQSRLFRIGGLLMCILVWLANSGNPPTGNTGAPFDGSCNNCHSGGNYNGSVVINGLPSTIMPGTTYTLNLTMTPSSGNPVRGGFQVVVVDGNNANAGNLTNSNAQSGTEFFNTREYLEHRNPKNFGGNPISWDFTWQAPASAAGNTIKFYYIGNFCNGSGSNDDIAFEQLETIPFEGGPPLTASITNQTNVSCFGGNNGSATAEGDGGTPPYTYKWNNNQTTQTAINLIAGTYTVTVTGGGTATATVVITQPPAITVTAAAAGQITCVNTSVNVTANASGGAGGFSYAWSNGDMNNPAVYSNPGPGSVTVTDNNGCTKVATFNITANTTQPNAVASSNSAFTCSTPSITLSGSGSSLGSNFAYFWTATGGGTIVSGGTTLFPVVNGCGTYTLLVTNTQNGCTKEASVTPTCNIVPPTLTLTGNTITCSNPTVVITASSNASNAAYAWTGPNFSSTLQNPTVSASGIYTCTVTNNTNSCTQTATTTVTENLTPPGANTTGTTLTCTNTSDTIFANSATSGVSYSWKGPNNYTSNVQNPIITLSGTYTVSVTNPVNGCASTATASVASNTTAPGASTTGTTLTCVNNPDTIFANSGTSGVTYAWTGPNNFISSQRNPIVSLSGDYIVTVTNPLNGCISKDTATVASNTVPPSITTTDGTLTCLITTLTICANTPAPSPSFAWSGPGGFTSTQQCPTVSLAGIYTVTVTNGENGCTHTATATAALDVVPPSVSIAPPGILNCNNLTVTLNASASSTGPNFSYNWTTTDGNIVSGANTPTPIVDDAGTYNLLITNTQNGCTATGSVTVNQTPQVNASTTTTSVSCNGGNNGSATATPGGGNGTFTYIWSSGASTATANNLSAGTYTVTITDGENCTATASAVVAQPAVLAVNASATNQTAAGMNDGTATANPSGGTPTYTYLWSNSATTQSITGLTPGSYTVTTTDANGCAAVQTVNVNAFNCNLSANASGQNVSCNGAANGSATVSTTGANGNVSYIWSTSATTQTISNLVPGNYTVTVTDASNCTQAQNVSITEPPVLSPNVTATGETSAGGNNGSASAAPTGGNSPYSYLWNTNATTSSINNLAPGNYTVTVTDAKNCTAVQTVAVPSFNCALVASTSTTQASCFGGNNGTASASALNGSGTLTYKWSNGGTTISITGLTAGTYIVTITDGAGCTDTETATVGQAPQLQFQATVTADVNCPLDPTGQAAFAATGGVPSYSFSASGGTPTGFPAGTYTATVTDGNGCTATATFTIKSLDVTPPSITCPNSLSICKQKMPFYPLPIVQDNCAPTPDISVVSGVPIGGSYNEGSTTQVFRATDLSGNSATCSFVVTVYPLPTATYTISPDTNNIGKGKITLTTGVGTGPFTFEWKKNGEPYAKTQNLDNLKEGSYSVLITDGNGCQTLIEGIEIKNVVGADEPAWVNNLRLFPNPTEAFLRLEMPEIPLRSAQILNPQGRIVQSINPADLLQEMDVTQLPSGVYYLRLSTQEGWSGMLKWIKM